VVTGTFWSPLAIPAGGGWPFHSCWTSCGARSRSRCWAGAPALGTRQAQRRSPSSWGDLPLALEEAAAYIDETKVGLSDYLRLARERTVELFRLEGPAADQQRVATAWSMSLDHVRSQAPAAAALLDLCAFLAPDDIPRELPCRDLDRLPSPLAQAARDPLAYNEALRALGRYSLATVTPTALGVHLLVQAVVRARLGPEGQRRWR
jgi:hypothetical protein